MSTVVPPPAAAPGEPVAARRLPPVVRHGAAGAGLLLSVALVAYGAMAMLDLLAWSTTTQRTSFPTVRTLRISLDSGGVELVRAPRGARVQVVTRVRRGLLQADADQRYAAGRLTLAGGCPAVFSVACDVHWRVTVPDGTAVSVDAAGGDVQLSGVQARGRLTVRSSGGDVRIRDLRATQLDASSSAGDVNVDFAVVPDDVRVSSSAGDVRVSVPAETYAVDASTSAGDTNVDVAQDDASPHRLQVSSSAGDVRVTRR